MSRTTVKIVSIVIAGALLVGVVLAAVSPAIQSGSGSTTTTTADSVAVSTDPETNVRNACVDWAKVAKGSDGSISANEISATLAEMATLADVAAAGNATYTGFAQSVHDMESAFEADDSAGVGTAIAAINPVCAAPH